MPVLNFEDLSGKAQRSIISAFLAICVREAGPRERTAKGVMRATGVSADDLWLDICAEAGVDLCKAWSGFPDKFFPLPEVHRIDLTDYSARN